MSSKFQTLTSQLPPIGEYHSPINHSFLISPVEASQMTQHLNDPSSTPGAIGSLKDFPKTDSETLGQTQLKVA